MPSWGVHIALANKLNKKFELGNDFIIGNVLPDATNGIIVKNIPNVINHAKTHYNFEGPNKPPKNDVDKFLEEYKDKLNNPLILGSLIHIMTDNFFNFYFKKNHTVNINGENIAMLNDYSLLYGITPWKLKQEEFGKFADYLICNNMLGNNIALTKDTLILLGDLSYELSLYDIGLVVCKINSIINKSVKELKEYKMFTFNELMCLYNDCYDYIEEEMPKIKKLERR